MSEKNLFIMESASVFYHIQLHKKMIARMRQHPDYYNIAKHICTKVISWALKIQVRNILSNCKNIANYFVCEKCRPKKNLQQHIKQYKKKSIIKIFQNNFLSILIALTLSRCDLEYFVQNWIEAVYNRIG